MTNEVMNRWNSKIDKITAQFEEAFGKLDSKTLNTKVNPEAWSIGQCIDHLIVINSTYFTIFADVRAGSHQPGGMSKIGFMVKFIGNMILKGVEPSRKLKGKTFPLWEPAQSDIPGDIVSQFREHQEKLKSEFNTLSEFIEKGSIISSPANKNIVYKLETALDIIVTHEERHFNQAKEVLNQINQS